MALPTTKGYTVLTPCQTFAATEGFEALDKLLFTTPKRAAKGIALLCDNCPSAEREACASRASTIVTPAGFIPAEGVFGGVFHA